jgi:hypothetical protein
MATNAAAYLDFINGQSVKRTKRIGAARTAKRTEDALLAAVTDIIRHQITSRTILNLPSHFVPKVPDVVTPGLTVMTASETLNKLLRQIEKDLLFKATERTAAPISVTPKTKSAKPKTKSAKDQNIGPNFTHFAIDTMIAAFEQRQQRIEFKLGWFKTARKDLARKKAHVETETRRLEQAVEKENKMRMLFAKAADKFAAHVHRHGKAPALPLAQLAAERSRAAESVEREKREKVELGAPLVYPRRGSPRSIQVQTALRRSGWQRSAKAGKNLSLSA